MYAHVGEPLFDPSLRSVQEVATKVCAPAGVRTGKAFWLPRGARSRSAACLLGRSWLSGSCAWCILTQAAASGLGPRACRGPQTLARTAEGRPPMLVWLAALAAVAVCVLAALRSARWRAAASLGNLTGAARLRDVRMPQPCFRSAEQT
jgi:hypothetical protein